MKDDTYTVCTRMSDAYIMKFKINGMNYCVEFLRKPGEGEIGVDLSCEHCTHNLKFRLKG